MVTPAPAHHEGDPDMAETPVNHPVAAPNARRWWLGRSVALAVSNAVVSVAVVALLLVGMTATMLRVALAVMGVAVVAHACVRWLTWRAWAEVPGGWWRRDAIPGHRRARGERWIQFATTFPVVWALVHTSVLMRTGALVPTDPRTPAWWGVTVALAALTPFCVVRRPSPSAGALLLALIVCLALVPAAWPAALPAAAGSLVLALADRSLHLRRG